MSIRTTTPLPPLPRIEDVVYTPDNTEKRKVVAIGPDGDILYISSDKDTASKQVLKSGTSPTGTLTTIKDFGSGNEVQGMWWTNDGEVLVSTRNATGKGQLWKSKDWATSQTTATWTSVLTVGGTDTGVNINGAWGFSMAPAGHPRSGLVFVAEYGGQSQENTTTPAGGASRVYVSTDHGATWRVIFHLVEQIGTRNQHMHGVAYDPYTDAVFISYGDGYAGGAARSAISWTKDWQNADYKSIVWEHVVAPIASAEWQVTTMYAVDAGIICGSDGAPDGIQLIPRKADGTYGQIFNVIRTGQYANIGQTIRRWRPEHPVLISQTYGTSYPRPVQIHGTMDGYEFYTLYSDPVLSTTVSGAANVVGPDANGKVWWAQSSDSRGAYVICSGTLVWER